MTIYIAGAITGVPDYLAKFCLAETQLAKQGYKVINPAYAPPGLNRRQYMKMSIAQLDCADAVALLPGWEKSGGANIEKAYADYIGLPCYEIKNGRLIALRTENEK